MEQLTKVYVSIGSNLGDRTSNLTTAIQFLSEKTGRILNASSVYETPPLGFNAENQFFNQCLCIETSLSPSEFIKVTQSIERDMGRSEKTTNGHYASRLIDIDLLYFGKEIIESENLTVPHKELRFRKFVLDPLKEIAPFLVDPIFHLTVSQLAINCKDTSAIRKIKQ